MNLSKLFELQRKLDEHIVKEKGLEGQDLLSKKILALQVKLGELANEARFFKYWSNDQRPRTELWKDCNFCGGRGFVSPANYPYGHQRITCIECRGESQFKTNPLLEEYVDCLYFILSIGLELNIPEIYGTETKWDELTSDETDITQQFLLVFESVNELVHLIDWINLFEEFYILGGMLGFTWDEIEKAYLERNKISYE